MSYEITAILIFFTSLIGMGVILLRKVPVLIELSEVPIKPFQWKDNSLKLIEGLKSLNPFKSFSPEIFLQKILSRIRILTLKTDSKTSSWLQKLREKSQKKKFKGSDNYWEDIKTSLPSEEDLSSSQHPESKQSVKKD